MPDRPFKQFARHYDLFMRRYVDYKSWMNYVEKVFRRNRIRPETVLDLACGTGIPTVMLAKRGYRMVGVDRSAEMLAVLESKRGRLPIVTIRADMTEFQLEDPVDAAICIYDSINYLLDASALEKCFRCVHDSLRPGGLFAFDMNTLYGLSEFWGDRTMPRKVGGIHSLWQNGFDPKTAISTLHLTFWEEPAEGSVPVQFEEVHQERAYERPEVRSRLEHAGFGRPRFYSHGGFLPVGPLTTRMMVVARRPARSGS